MSRLTAVAAIVLYAAVYAASAYWLNERGAFPLEEALMILAIVGVGFSFLSWVTTIGIKPPNTAGAPTVARPAAETLVMLLLAAAIAAFLVWGKTWADNIIPDAAHGGSDFSHLANVLVAKLAVFVVVPFLVVRALFGHGLRSFGLGGDAWRRLLGREGFAALAIGIAICAFQYFAGRGAAPIRDGTISGDALWIGLPLAFLWLMLLVGLVEEFFFRGVMQTRLAALFKSEVAGLVLMALLFGLMHAPGMVLRDAGVVEGLGANPDWATAAAYTVVVQSVAAFYLGIFWLRTRNLPAVMIIHAATDLLPNLSDFVKPFGLVP